MNVGTCQMINFVSYLANGFKVPEWTIKWDNDFWFEPKTIQDSEYGCKQKNPITFIKLFAQNAMQSCAV